MSRTGIAACLTAVTIGVPCSAWYVAGRESVARERERLVNVARLGAENVALGLAERIGGRLETLRETESRRPPYHYAPHYHDPTSDCACASTTPSPLLDGPVDPLVWTHLQVDADGHLTLPSLPHEDAVGTARGGRFQLLQRALYAQLRGSAAAFAACATHGLPEANAVYGGGVAAASGAAQVIDQMRWHTIDVEGRPMLAAVRHVSEAGRLVHQGFIVSTEHVNDLLTGAFYEATFAPSTEECIVAVAVDVAGASWHVDVDAADALASARREGDEEARKLNRTFAGVTIAAMLAGIAVVGLIWQTDRLSRARSRFAASAAHELRTPLAGLRVYGDMLAEGLGDKEKTATYARHIASEADRLGRVVANVLGYSQLERGELAVNTERGDLGRVVADCVERLRAALEMMGAHIEVVVPNGLPTARFDADAVFHVVQNLLDNAERYTRDATDRRIHVRVSDEGDAVAVSVADHGGGVPREMRTRMFDAFTRGADSEAPNGLGLGLMLVANLMRAQRGRVVYAEAPGGGAIFSVTFPAA